MSARQTIPAHRLILSLSAALDGVEPPVAGRQRRAAAVALAIAGRMALPARHVLDIFLAGCLHDIGLIRPEHRRLAEDAARAAELSWHCRTGHDLLRHADLLGGAAEVVRDHHVRWRFGQGRQVDGRTVPFGAHVLAVADFVERSIDWRAPVLAQVRDVADRAAALADSRFHPDCADAFRSVAESEALWLDCAGPGLDEMLLEAVPGPSLPIGDMSVRQIVTIFGRVVDAMSVWTATHSAGVAAAADEIAALMKLSPRERTDIHVAGWLHDAGMLVAGGEVLDQPRALSQRQRAILKAHPHHTRRILDAAGMGDEVADPAALHHERPDGQGYPYRLKARDLPLAGRVMAVADALAALVEDRPHRAAVSPAAARRALDDMAADGGLDGDVVGAVGRNFEQVSAARRRNSDQYARAQQHLVETTRYPMAA